MGTTVVLDQPGGTYVTWESWRGVLHVGTREETQALLAAKFLSQAHPSAVLERVDTDGTSLPRPNGVGDPQFGWADPGISSDELWPSGPIGWLPRERLVKFARALMAGDDEAAAALIESDKPADTDAQKDLP